MTHLQIIDSSQLIVLQSGKLSGNDIIESEKKISQLATVFSDETARQKMNPDTLVYSVQAHIKPIEGTPGGLYFGTSTIYPGKVDKEYFMTRGHFHTKSDRAEYYWGIQGQGMLLLMDKNRNTWAERVYPGSLHYIEPHIAHRLANTGDSPLIVGACWPSDAGHNYEEIDQNGFSARLVEKDGKATLINNL